MIATDGIPLTATASLAGRVITKALYEDVTDETAPLEKAEALTGHAARRPVAGGRRRRRQPRAAAREAP